MSQPTELTLVQKTEFEELAAQIEAENRAENPERDCQIKCLKKIMLAYSYVRCVLESRPRKLTSEEVKVVNDFIVNVIWEKNEQLEKKVEGYRYFSKTSYSIDSHLWFTEVYQKNAFRNVVDGSNHLTKESYYWDAWRKSNPKSETTLKTQRLQEDLWDYESNMLRYDKLPNLVETYPWAFPPNIVELHKEMVATERRQNDNN